MSDREIHEIPDISWLDESKKEMLIDMCKYRDAF